MRRLAIAVGALALLGVVAGCGGDDDSSGGTTTGVTASESERMDVKGMNIAEVAMHDEFFKPAFVGTPGQKVTIDLKNEGKAAHTFTVDEQLA